MKLVSSSRVGDSDDVTGDLVGFMVVSPRVADGRTYCSSHAIRVQAMITGISTIPRLAVGAWRPPELASWMADRAS
jgi:hypothetical protein